jgi:hypothetical protein
MDLSDAVATAMFTGVVLYALFAARTSDPVSGT